MLKKSARNVHFIESIAYVYIYLGKECMHVITKTFAIDDIIMPFIAVVI